MSISQVSISAAARQNLLALQNTAKLLQQTQGHLASGKKVNSALDDATAYFQSAGFLSSASDLSSLKNSMQTAVQTITSASDSIGSITSIVNQMQALTTSALQTSDTPTRLAYATQFNGLMTQLDGIAGDSTFNGINLLTGTAAGGNLVVNFNATNTTMLTVASTNVTSAGLLVVAATAGWSTDASITTSAGLLTTALSTLRSTTSSLGGNNTVVSARLDFTTNMITSLQTASDNLVLADTNAEGANMQALQAQSQLGVVALGISGTQASAILRLF